MWHATPRFERRRPGTAGIPPPTAPWYPCLMNRFLRHFAACDNAVLPGRRLPFRVGAATVGWVLPEFARLLAEPDDAWVIR